jgi:hypothetical protein
MNELKKLIAEIEAVENMYLDKKQILKRLKSISKHEKTTVAGIPYDSFSDEFKRSIDSIENELSNGKNDAIICNRVNRTDNNRCINCGAKSGHECQIKPNQSDYC